MDSSLTSFFCFDAGKRFFPVTFVGSILWIAGFSYLMVWWANLTGEAFEITPEVSTISSFFHSRQQNICKNGPGGASPRRRSAVLKLGAGVAMATTQLRFQVVVESTIGLARRRNSSNNNNNNNNSRSPGVERVVEHGVSQNGRVKHERLLPAGINEIDPTVFVSTRFGSDLPPLGRIFFPSEMGSRTPFLFLGSSRDGATDDGPSKADPDADDRRRKSYVHYRPNKRERERERESERKAKRRSTSKLLKLGEMRPTGLAWTRSNCIQTRSKRPKETIP